MAALQVVRWTKYGKDRLYVNEATGANVGWVDMTRGQRHLADPAFATEFDQAIAQYLNPQAMTKATILAEMADAIGVARPKVAPEPNGNLALNEPGQGAFARAAGLREVSPFKTFFARLIGMHSDERAWRVGGRGEQKVAWQLRRLGPEWKALHSVPVGKADSDIDHVLIGPGGVFTLNAKFHPDASVWSAGDAFMVNGQRVPYVRNSRFEVARADRILTMSTGMRIDARGVIVVVGARRGMKVKSQPEDGKVLVLTRRQLVRWLQKQPQRLSNVDVERIYAHARRAETWRGVDV